MLETIKKKKYLYIGIVLFGLLLIGSYFIKIPNIIKGPCRFRAQVEWSLVQTEPDKLQSKLVRPGKGLTETFDLFHFNRPDYIQVSLTEGLQSGKFIKKNQMVARIHSMDDEIQLSTLRGQLNQARSNLQVYLSGAKVSMQEEALESIRYAEAQLATYQPQWKRSKELFKAGLISQEELDIADTQNQLYQINIELQKAKLKTLQTGEKNEIIQLTEKEIQYLEEQCLLLNRKLEAEKIRSPISGIVGNATLNEDEKLVQIFKIDTIVVEIPIQENQIRYIQPEQPVNITSIHNPGKTWQGFVQTIGQHGYLINGNVFFIVTLFIQNEDQILLPEMTGRAKIESDKVSIFNLMMRSTVGFR